MKKVNHLVLVCAMLMTFILGAAAPHEPWMDTGASLTGDVEGPTPTVTNTPDVPTDEPTATATELVEPTATATEPVAPTATATAEPTAAQTLEPTATEEPDPTAVPFSRPLVVISSYSSGDGVITPGNEFSLRLRLKNKGGAKASNLIVNFENGDLMPLKTGGVQALSSLDVDDAKDLSQPMRANFSLWGYDTGSTRVTVSYTDPMGTPYTETFTVTVPLKISSSNGASPTATPTTQPSAQLVVDSYHSDVDPLQPGSIFNLDIQLRNLGSVNARNVSMVLGGGVSADVSSDGSGGSHSAGGLSGGGADLTNFAPLGRSNVVFLDTVSAGANASASIQLVVNVSTTPGAYPFKISFVYDDPEGNRVVDDQVITLLVYSLPRLQFGFYRDPGIFFTEQMNSLPLQITNLGKNTVVLGNMTVTSTNGNVTENTTMVGALEPGGYFTMDSFLFPMGAGEVPLTISVSYTDDFNQTRTVENELVVTVEEQPVMEPMPEMETENDFMMEEEQSETFLQKIVRIVKGFFGLGSGKNDAAEMLPMDEEMDFNSAIAGPRG